MAGKLLSAAEPAPVARERALTVRCSRAGTQEPARNTSSTTLQGEDTMQGVEVMHGPFACWPLSGAMRC